VPVPTIALAHGGLGHGPWQWSHLIPELRSRGVAAVTHDRRIPTAEGWKLASDPVRSVRTMHELLDAFDGPKILVGHSGGGPAITDAGAGRHDVVGLVYVTAFMTGGDVGIEVTERVRPLRTMPLDSMQAEAAELFFHDVESPIARWAASQLVETLPYLKPPDDFSPGVAWHEKRSTYIVATNDRAIDPDHQRRHAAQADEVFEIETGHSPFLARPAELADLLARVAESHAS
jgi:pimeloyl-ACP methyl ester carboxylesterase